MSQCPRKGKVIVRITQDWKYKWFKTIIVLSLGFCIEEKASIAQVVPDTTLGNENSIVTPNATIKNLPGSLIEGGAERGANLFHSFSEFSIGDLQRVYFANPIGIETIFSRVTGNNVSNINGVLGVLVGNADLFFLNPNGIIFGENASLDINGSFIGSTANSLVFGDDFAFSAIYYNDRGNSDYARITDFDVYSFNGETSFDRIEILGSSSSYDIQFNIETGDTEISYQGDRIAVIENINLTSDTLDGDISRYFI